jgi:hypothetical protein
MNVNPSANIAQQPARADRDFRSDNRMPSRRDVLAMDLTILNWTAGLEVLYYPALCGAGDFL